MIAVQHRIAESINFRALDDNFWVLITANPLRKERLFDKGECCDPVLTNPTFICVRAILQQLFLLV